MPPPAARTKTASAARSSAFLETANVNSVTELTDLISAQRAYEMNAKVITASDEMLSSANNIIR